MSDEPDTNPSRAPQAHRTIDRVTRILEEVVYAPGITFAELARALDAPKSTVYGFIQGLVASGWLHREGNNFYVGPALHGLALASGRLRSGSVLDTDLHELHRATGVTVFLGVQAGDDLINVAEVGAELLHGFAAQTNIRRGMLETAGGKALLAAMRPADRDAYLRRRRRDAPELVETFLSEYDSICESRVARNLRLGGTRFALATVVNSTSDTATAEITLVGRAEDMLPREEKLVALLLKSVDSWHARTTAKRR